VVLSIVPGYLIYPCVVWWLNLSSVPPGECRDNTLKLGHNHFLPNPFQFIIHIPAYHSTLYSLSY
jgi:hypothetical protein